MSESFRSRVTRHMQSFPGHAEGAMTIGAFVRSVMEIHEDTEAQEFLRGYREWLRHVGEDENPGIPDGQAEFDLLIASNIGWCFGEGMSYEDRQRWIRLVDARHPYFGRSVPSVQEAFEAGVKAGRDLVTKQGETSH